MTLKELDRMARNTGCMEHNDCLTCPLPKCIYDIGRVRGPRGKGTKAQERYSIIRQMAKYMRKGEIAKQLGISRCTVWYALKEQ